MAQMKHKNSLYGFLYKWLLCIRAVNSISPEETAQSSSFLHYYYLINSDHYHLLLLKRAGFLSRL